MCKGNVCRSPFAEALASSFGVFDPVASAGCLETAGKPAPPEAVAAARLHGVDLAAHRSRSVNRELLAAADVVFVLDREIAEVLARRHAGFEQRTLLLGALSDSGAPEIADPWGRGGEAFEECYRAIRCALEAVRLIRGAALPQTEAPAGRSSRAHAWFSDWAALY